MALQRRRRCPSHHSSVIVKMSRITALLPVLVPFVLGGEKELEKLMGEMEQDVLSFAAEMESAHAKRCAQKTFDDCVSGSYEACKSEFPQQTCPGGDFFSRPTCGDGVTCGGLFDFTTTSVRIPDSVRGGLEANGNPRDDLAKESICYSLQAENYMVEKFQNDTVRRNGVAGGAASAMFFGSDSATFRKIPATQDAKCGVYDNTQRPWYVAATSGPKDVVLVLDTSGSMVQRGRLQLMKDAARRVVETLTVGDHVAVIAFNTVATEVLDKGTMIQATDRNKRILLDAIDALETKGSTNFLAAFELAFEVFKTSHLEERSSFCHSAILFLTDGIMTVPENVTAADVVGRIQELEAEIDVNPYIFLYSLGFEANRGEAASVPRSIACSTGGVWSRVEEGGDLAAAMAGYYKLFALGLGDDVNEGFVAWVDPYKFATGGVMGTTVSAPVYDRTVTPHVLLGAVGFDFPMAAMDSALGEDSGSRTLLMRLVQRSTAFCPQLQLNQCEIQSLRHAAGGEDALCPGECTEFVGITPQACGTSSNYPEEFWVNSNNMDRTFIERTCCTVGETRVAGQYSLGELNTQYCIAGESALPTPTNNTPTVIGSSIAAVALLSMCFFAIFIWRRQKKNRAAAQAYGANEERNPNCGRTMAVGNRLAMANAQGNSPNKPWGGQPNPPDTIVAVPLSVIEEVDEDESVYEDESRTYAFARYEADVGAGG